MFIRFNVLFSKKRKAAALICEVGITLGQFSVWSVSFGLKINTFCWVNHNLTFEICRVMCYELHCIVCDYKVLEKQMSLSLHSSVS
jgi:hypothetical protein